jgi:ATP-dependent helicase/nuclease subunit A
MSKEQAGGKPHYLDHRARLRDRFEKGAKVSSYELLEVLPRYPAALWTEKGRTLLQDHYPEMEETTLLDEALQVLTTYGDLFSDPAASEMSFFLPGKGVGRIDRLYVTDEALWLVDFKTDRRIPKSFEQIPESYKNQLRFYYEAFRCNDMPVKVALLWTAAPFLMEIPVSFLFQRMEKRVPVLQQVFV